MTAEAGPSSGLTRVPDLWFTDGSLIVRAENTISRVSGAVLAARSSVFQDMLSFPQPGSPTTLEAETFDGVPIVELQDLAAEVEPFLRAIFDSSFFMPPPSAPQLSDILAIVRLSNKYDIQYLFRRAISHLAKTYPTELPPFLEHLNHYPTGFESLKSTPDAHLQVLRVLHEVNALWLLPAAYARAAKCLPARLFSAASWPLLPEPIKLKLHLAHAHQARHIITIVHAVGGEPDTDTCVAPASCPLEILSVVTALLEQVGQVDMEFNFFDVKDIFLPSVWEDLGAPMCARCMAHRAQAVEGSMRTVWEALPGNLGLPPWEELKKMREAAMGG
ncbi:BTB domain-containing protein [Mycena venus]|uniref:BTB domain-containing protein n=1 Tax=Mycena venus TaxID=2733690 RepID=A0A8H6Z288_9AGAR|nr:BTB domain-containing protein [Mycena venus]